MDPQGGTLISVSLAFCQTQAAAVRPSHIMWTEQLIYRMHSKQKYHHFILNAIKNIDLGYFCRQYWNQPETKQSLNRQTLDSTDCVRSSRFAYQFLAKPQYEIDNFHFFLVLNPRHKVLNTTPSILLLLLLLLVLVLLAFAYQAILLQPITRPICQMFP